MKNFVAKTLRMVVVFSACHVPIARGADDPAELEHFENRVRPVLIQYCYECHSAASTEAKGGLRLDSRDGIRRGGESGPAVVPGKLAESLLLDAVRHESFKMPPDRRLPDAIVNDLVRWIERGAVDPRDKPPTADEAAELSWQAIFAERRNWWSLQPLGTARPPEVADPAWSTSAVDRFIKAKLDEAQIEPAAEAEPAVLLRRLSFALTGLPPTAEMVAEFSGNSITPSLPNSGRSDGVGEWGSDRVGEDKKYAALVDRLLASPHFGEHFARHWMDVVRYGDTYGYEWDVPAKGAWRYRDYLIRAFNADVGFDQLVKEQLAGDLLESPRVDHAAGVNESLIGPMFYHLGEHRHGDSLDFNGIHQEMVNNKIDAFSKAFLATTVACARCHDHKLDAVAQKDYYALASVFMTPRWTTRQVDMPQRNRMIGTALDETRGTIRTLLEQRWRGVFDELPELVAKAMRDTDDAARKAAKPEDPAYPIVQLATAKNDADLAAKWNELATAWRTTHETRRRENAAKFRVIADFRDGRLPPGWTSEGLGAELGWVKSGTLRLALDGERIVAEILPAGLYTNTLSPRLPGSLRLPRLQTLGGKYASLQLAGGEWAGHITIVENAFQSERLQYLNDARPAWKQFETFLDKPEWNVRLEIATSDLNPNFPARWGKVKSGDTTLNQRDDGTGKPSWFGITQAVVHDEPGVPLDDIARFAPLYAGAVPRSRQAAAAKIAAWFDEALYRWYTGTATDEDVPLLNFLLERNWLTNRFEPDARRAVGSTLSGLVSRYRFMEGNLAPPETVNGMDERGTAPAAYRLNIRGNVDELGDAVPHDFLRVFAGRNDVAKSPGSGRRELAEFLVRGDHPLTARVYVNRVWGWLFGEGLVRTPDDFGHLGRLPTHPELLDHLAREFAADGWSTKRLIRRLVLSRTFRQAGTATEQARTVDAENRWWHHVPTRRLEAEAIRDAMLAVSGRLDEKLFGPPIDPPRAKEDEMKRLFSGPLDGLGRRSIYQKMTIMEPPKFLAAFNQPSPKIPTGRRDVTNAASQALALLNDPFVVQQAEFWAKRLCAKPQATVQERLGEMFVRAFARPPTVDELALWTAALDDFASDGVETDAALLQDVAAWTRAAHAMFNVKEFIYVR
jgi:hypothetical protein